jgi:hypothetical protein
MPLSPGVFINSVRKMRGYSPRTALCIEKFGSDCCEKQFSAQGSWQQNKRNCSASTMQSCSQKENWLNDLEVNKDGPRWAQPKIHRQEWDNEDEEGGLEIDFVVPADLDDRKIADCAGRPDSRGEKALGDDGDGATAGRRGERQAHQFECVVGEHGYTGFAQ